MALLTTRNRVKSYLNLTTSGSDTVIDNLIPVASRLIEQYTSRVFPVITRAGKRLDGTGNTMLTLPDQPIVSLQSISIGDVALEASTSAAIGAGYVIDRWTVFLTGGQVFTRGVKNVTVSYVAGYFGSQTDAIPTGNSPTITPTSDDEGNSGAGFAFVDEGVVSESGAAFSLVANGPTAGQYTFSDGVYGFSSSDAGTDVTMSYYYVPSAIEQACIELVGLDLRQRTNLGQKSQNLEGQSVTWEDRSMPPSVKELVNPYRRVFPA